HRRGSTPTGTARSVPASDVSPPARRAVRIVAPAAVSTTSARRDAIVTPAWRRPRSGQIGVSAARVDRSPTGAVPDATDRTVRAAPRCTATLEGQPGLRRDCAATVAGL